MAMTGRESAVTVALLLAVCAGLPAAAQAATLKVQLDTDRLALDEVLVVTVQANGRHALLQVGETDDFEITNQTNEFSQPIFCMAMGLEVISGPCVFTFHFAPKRAGELTVPAFQLVDNFWDRGRVLRQSGTATVVVSEETAGPRSPRRKPAERPRPGRRQGGLTPVRPESQESRRPPQEQAAVTVAELRDLSAFSQFDIFLLPRLDREAYYLSEPFRIDYLLYVGERSGASQIQGMELPDLEGFRKERLEVAQAREGEATVGGKRYEIYVLARYVLVPMEPGDRLLPSARAIVLASSSSYQQFNGGFSFSFSSGSEPVEIFSPPLKLSIKRVPEPRPAGFVEANVGRFELKSVAFPPPQPAGSWMVLKVAIDGHGNLLSLVPPTLSGEGLESRAPYLENRGVKIDEQGIHGTIEVQIPFRLLRPGEFDLGSLRLVYFDPQREEFSGASLPLPRAVATAPAGAAEGPARPDGRQLAPIVTDAPLIAATEPGPARQVRLLLVGTGLASLLWLIGVVARLASSRLGADPARRRRREALATVRSELGRAASHLRAGDLGAFHAALHRALTAQLEARLGTSPGAVSLSNLESALVGRGLSVDLAARVREELESADFGRFAPTSLQSSDMQSALARVTDLVNKLQRQRARRPS